MDTLVDFLLNFYGPTPYLLVFGILLLCGFGLPIPEDITLIAAGLLAYYGVSNLEWIIAVCFAGVMVGDSAMYYLGRHYGRPLMRKWVFKKLLPEHRLEAASRRFHGPGGKRVLFAARFMPGLRAPMFFSAGLLHVPFWKFFVLDGLAALISVPAIVGAVYHFGDELDMVVRYIKKVEGGIVIVIVAAAALVSAKWWLTHRRKRNEITPEAR